VTALSRKGASHIGGQAKADPLPFLRIDYNPFDPVIPAYSLSQTKGFVGSPSTSFQAHIRLAVRHKNGQRSQEGSRRNWGMSVSYALVRPQKEASCHPRAIL
jgi:hypothetical protein